MCGFLAKFDVFRDDYHTDTRSAVQAFITTCSVLCNPMPISNIDPEGRTTKRRPRSGEIRLPFAWKRRRLPRRLFRRENKGVEIQEDGLYINSALNSVMKNPLLLGCTYALQNFANRLGIIARTRIAHSSCRKHHLSRCLQSVRLSYNLPHEPSHLMSRIEFKKFQ